MVSAFDSPDRHAVQWSLLLPVDEYNTISVLKVLPLCCARHAGHWKCTPSGMNSLTKNYWQCWSLNEILVLQVIKQQNSGVLFVQAVTVMVLACACVCVYCIYSSFCTLSDNPFIQSWGCFTSRHTYHAEYFLLGLKTNELFYSVLHFNKNSVIHFFLLGFSVTFGIYFLYHTLYPQQYLWIVLLHLFMTEWPFMMNWSNFYLLCLFCENNPRRNINVVFLDPILGRLLEQWLDLNK